MEPTPKLSNFGDMCDVFIEKNIPNETKTYLKLAKKFDEIIHGAHIRYNCLLQKRFGTDAKLDEFTRRWDVWRRRITGDNSTIRDFDEDMLFELSHTMRPYSRGFVRNWIKGLRISKPIEYFDRLVVDQERANKGEKARLRPGATEKVNDWIGIDGLSYRFLVVRDIVNDIKNGLGY